MSVTPSPQGLPAVLTRRNTFPILIPAASIQCAEFAIDPVWNRHRPDVAALAAEINDRPMSLALLEVVNGQLGHFMTPEPTRKQEG